MTLIIETGQGNPEAESYASAEDLAMDGMTWKGRKTSSEQALAAEIHQDDIDPIEKRKGAVTLERVEGAVTREYATIPNTSGRLLPAAPDRPKLSSNSEHLRNSISVV